jgi:hypothetical protein
VEYQHLEHKPHERTTASADNSKTRSSFLFQEFGGETSQFFKKNNVILQQM